MRSARMIFGLALVVCAFTALTSSAFAAEEVKFGEFVANVVGGTITPATPAEAKSKEGGTGEIVLGPYTIECTKEPTSKGFVTEERSSSFSTTMSLKGCKTVGKAIGAGENEKGEKIKLIEESKVSLKIPITFHSNGTGSFEEGAELGSSSFIVKGQGRDCVVTVPAQAVPAKVGKAGSEFVTFTNEEGEIKESKKAMEEFPAGFQAALEVEMELKKIRSTVALSNKCVGENAAEEELTSGTVEFKAGKVEADLEEIKIKHGNLSFEEPAV
jgi:hypothetical protein